MGTLLSALYVFPNLPFSISSSLMKSYRYNRIKNNPEAFATKPVITQKVLFLPICLQRKNAALVNTYIKTYGSYGKI